MNDNQDLIKLLGCCDGPVSYPPSVFTIEELKAITNVAPRYLNTRATMTDHMVDELGRRNEVKRSKAIASLGERYVCHPSKRIKKNENRISGNSVSVNYRGRIISRD